MANESSKKNSTAKRKKTTEKELEKETKKVTKTTKKSTPDKNTKKTNTSSKKSKSAKTKSKATTKTTGRVMDSSKKTSSTKKASTRKTSTSRSRKPKSTAKEMLTEYYDLPYGYNQTTVKVLAQTPTTLFVYWDISKEDRNALESLHGENFFSETKPILIVHNVTRNYSFEIEINDFANSWYIRTQEPDCDYIIELGRKAFNTSEKYVYISSSNDIISPNDHILFESANLGNVLFKNVKTNVVSSKDFGSLTFINNIDKLYGNVYDVYSRLYDEETLDEVAMPGSSEFIRKRERGNTNE